MASQDCLAAKGLLSSPSGHPAYQAITFFNINLTVFYLLSLIVLDGTKAWGFLGAFNKSQVGNADFKTPKHPKWSLRMFWVVNVPSMSFRYSSLGNRLCPLEWVSFRTIMVLGGRGWACNAVNASAKTPGTNCVFYKWLECAISKFIDWK